MSDGPGKSKSPAQGDFRSPSISTEYLKGGVSPESEGVRSHESVPSIPKDGPRTPATAIRKRMAEIKQPEVAPVSPAIQTQLDKFCLTGSAYSFLSLLNSDQGLKGTFNIVYQPEGDNNPIPLSDFNQKGNEKIRTAYEKVTKQITNNSQSVAHRLMEDMAKQQQWMAETIMEQQRQQAELNSQMNAMHAALLQAMMNPVVRPMPVPFNYLSGLSGNTLPQQGGMPGGMPAQPVWAQYSQPMMAIQPGLQQPFSYPALQQGFCAVPAYPEQSGTGLQLPFSPLGQYFQQASGFGTQLGLLPQFCQGTPQSLVPSWAYAPFASQATQPNILNNFYDGHSSQRGGGVGAPAVNANISPVIRNNVQIGKNDNGYSALQDAVRDILKKIKDLRAKRGSTPENSQEKQALSDRLKELEEEFSVLRKQQNRRKPGAEDTSSLGDEFVPAGDLDDQVIQRGAKPSRTIESDPHIKDLIDQNKKLIEDISKLREELRKVNSPEQLENLINKLAEALGKNNQLTKENVNLAKDKNDLEGVILDLEKVIKELNGHRDKHDTSNSQLVEELAQLKNELEDKDKKINEQEKVIENQDQNIDSLKKEIEGFYKEIESLKQKNSNLVEEAKQQKNKLDEQISKLQKDIDENVINQDKLKELQEKLLKKETELEELNDAIDMMDALHQEKIRNLNNGRDIAINDLSNELEALRRNSDKEIADLKQGILDLEGQLSDKNGQIADLEQKINVLESRDGSDDKELEALRSELKHTQSQLHQVQEEKDNLESALNEANERNKQLETESENLQKVLEEKIQSHEDSIEKMRRNITELEAEIERKAETIKALKESNGDSDENIKKLQEDLKHLQAELAKEKQQLNNRLDEMKSELDNQLQRAAEKENDLENELRNVIEQRDDLTAQIEGLKKDIENIKGDGSELETTLNRQIEILEQERDAKQQELDSLSHNLDQLKEKIQDLLNQLEQLKEEYEEALEAAKKDADEKIAGLNDIIKTLENDKQTKDSEIAANAVEIKALQDSSSTDGQTLAQLQGEQIRLEGEREAAVKEITGLKEELAEAKAQINSLEGELEKLREERVKEQQTYKEALEAAKKDADEKIAGLNDIIKTLEDDKQTKDNEIAIKVAEIQALQENGDKGSQALVHLQEEQTRLEGERDADAKEIAGLKEELEKAKDSIGNLEDELKNLQEAKEEEQQAHKETLEQAATTAQEEITALNDKISQLENDKQTKDNEIAIKVAEIQALQASGDKGSQALLHLQEEQTRLEGERDADAKEIAGLKEELEKAKDSIGNLEDELKNLQEAKEEEQQAHKETLEQAATTAQEEITALNDKISQLENDKQTKDREIADKEAEIKVLRESSSTDGQALARLEGEKAGLENERETAVKDIEKLKEGMEKAKAQIDKLKDELKNLREERAKEQQEHKETLEQAATTAQEEITALKDNIHQLENDKQTKDKEIAIKVAEIQALNESSDTGAKTLARLEGEKAGLESEREAATNEIGKLKAHIDNLGSELQKLEDEIAKEKKEHEDILNNTKNASDEVIKHLNEDLNKLTEAKNQKDKEIEAKLKEIAKLKQDENINADELTRLEKELETLVQEKDVAENKIKILEDKLEKAYKEIASLKDEIDSLKNKHKTDEAKLQDELKKAQDLANTEKNKKEKQIGELEVEVEKLKEQDFNNNEAIAKKEKDLKEAQKKHTDSQSAHQQRIDELEKERNDAKRAAAVNKNPTDFIKNMMKELGGQDFDLKNLPTEESAAQLLSKLTVEDLDVAELEPELKARWLIFIKSAQALDRLNIENSDREKSLKAVKAKSLPASLEESESVLNGVEQLTEIRDIDDTYINKIKDIKKNLSETIDGLTLDGLSEEVKGGLKKAYLDQALDYIDSVIKVVSDDRDKNSDAIGFVEKAIVSQKTEDVSIKPKNINNDLSDYLNDELIQNKVRSEFESANKVDANGAHSSDFQRKVSNHKALKLLKGSLRSILVEEKKILSSKAKSFEDIEKSRKTAANVRAAIESLRLANNKEIAESIPEEFQTHWEKYIDIALESHQAHILSLEYDNESEVIDRLSGLLLTLPDDIKISNQKLKTLKKNLSTSVRGVSGVEKAISLLQKNDDLLADVIWAANRAYHMKNTDEFHDKQIYGKDISETDQRLALQKMLIDAYVRHGVTDQITPAEMVTALVDQVTRIDSKAIEIASERYGAESGETKGKLLRNQKIIGRCLSLLQLDLKDATAFWRGVSIDQRTKEPKDLNKVHHMTELKAFSKGEYLSLPDDWGKRKAEGGTREVLWKPGGKGLLDSFYIGQGDVKIKEHVDAGERFISKNESGITFIQRKKPDGQYGKMTVDINGTKRELDPKLFLAYPNYQSPFHEKRHRNSIPLTSTVTSEVGELVYSGDKKFPEHYYRIVNKGKYPDSTPVLQCVAIGEDNLSEEEFHGSVVGWLACSNQPNQKTCAEALANQAWKAYQEWTLSQGKTPDSELFRQSVASLANIQRQQGKDWFDSEKCNVFIRELKNDLPQITTSTKSDTTMPNAVSAQSLENTAVILPSALLEAMNRRSNSSKRRVPQAHFAKASLPTDFDYHIDEHTRLLSVQLGGNHPCEPEIKKLREQEKEMFTKGVFYPLHVFEGTEISLEEDGGSRGRDIKGKPLTLQIKAMRQQLQLKTEENMSYVEDCAVLEQKVLSLMPDSMQPCSIEDAKRIFGQVEMSEVFAKTMMAYLAVESAKDISRGLIRNIKVLLGEMTALDRKRLRMESADFIKACRAINFKNAGITRKYMAMHQRLIDKLSTERLDPQGIAAKKYENTKGTILRDYQLDPAHKMLMKVQKMAEASKSSGSNREKKNRIVCQLGTGFGKTELTKMLMNQACLEGMGAGYIGPQSNVKNYNVDLSRHMKTAGGKCQNIDFKKIKSEHGSQWWKKEECLKSIQNIICGLPKNSSGEVSKTKIPWTMSTADLGVILALHEHSARAGEDTNNDKILRDIVSQLSGASRSNRPLIMRDEFDTFDDSEDIAKHCKEILGSKVVVNADANRLQRLSYDFSIHNAIYLSASKDSDYISLIRADEVSLDKLAEASNKDVNTCELRAEQYLLKARWTMQKGDSLRDTVKTAVQQFGAHRDLVFCDPTYNNKGGSQKMAWDGIEAMNAPDVSQGKEVKGHLYFKDGKYYCYNSNSARYGKKVESNTGIITLGSPLTEADQAEIMKTGGAGYITWMSEKRGYTAAQKNEEPDTTAFVFRNLSQLSPSDRQQMLGRDRNIEEYSDHDNMVIVTDKEVIDWKPENNDGSSIKNNAKKLLEDYETKKKALSNDITGKAKRDLIETAVNADIPYTASKGVRGKVTGEHLEAGFNEALKKQTVIWGELGYPSDKMAACAKARWSAVHYMKNQLFTFRSAEFDVSDDKVKLESQADHASKHAAVNDLRQQEQDFVTTDLKEKVDEFRPSLQEKVVSVMKSGNINTKDKQQNEVARKVMDTVCQRVKMALGEYEVKKVKLNELGDSATVQNGFSNEKSKISIKDILTHEEKLLNDKSYTLESSNSEISSSFNSVRDQLISEAETSYTNKISSLRKIISELTSSGYRQSPTGEGIEKLKNKVNSMSSEKALLSKMSDKKLLSVEEMLDKHIKNILDELCEITFFPRSGIEGCDRVKNIFWALSDILYTDEAVFDTKAKDRTSKSVPVIMQHRSATEKKFTFRFERSTDNNAGYQIQYWHCNSKNTKPIDGTNFKMRKIASNQLIRNTDTYKEKYEQKLRVSKVDENIRKVVAKEIADVWSKGIERSHAEKYESLKQSAEEIDIKRKSQQTARLQGYE